MAVPITFSSFFFLYITNSLPDCKKDRLSVIYLDIRLNTDNNIILLNYTVQFVF